MMQTTLPQCGAILAAGGIGARMAAGRPKQFLNVAGAPILARSCRVLLALPEVTRLVVVAPAAHLDHCRRLCREFLPEADQARLVFTAGGATRQDSVRAGLALLTPESSPEPPLVLVHDAARPLADAALCRRVLAAAARHGAAIAALPVTDTIKEVAEADDETDGLIRATLDRGRLRQAQTPQAVRLDLWRAALARADEEGFQATDEAALLEHAGIPVRVVLGSPANIKITRPEDLRIAEALLAEDETNRTAMMKIGHGFDAHRLVAGRKLILGGVEIAHPLGLLGHSDADVACHALMDAILGALGLGDIGRHFPDSDPAFAGARSLDLLARVTGLMEERGFGLGNADITIVCQRPKLAPHLPGMRANLARACGADADRVNVKATTTEEMGYAGRGEGIAAHAVVLLERRKPWTEEQT